ncbi:GNAT family N-acetyltransferase [Candidatus Gracilibacteria bacterium]|nr:GNAT family N-acetyltransferase [Candidatus Gracilibacteria bacterium]
MKRLFGKYMQLVKFERVDTEPTKELLKAHGFTRGFVIWIPFRRTDIPKGWRKLAVGTHFTRTGFVKIENHEYYKKWNERARRARKKFLSFIDSGIHIELVDQEEFVRAFQSIKVRHMFKSDYIRYYRAMSSIGENAIRSYVCYRGDTPISGLAVHDYSPTESVHLVAFMSREANSIQAGTGLIDRWFSDSVDRGIEYINFDHLRDSSMEKSQQGYTDFKLNFIEHECYFTDSYFRFL